MPKNEVYGRSVVTPFGVHYIHASPELVMQLADGVREVHSQNAFCFGIFE